MALPTIWTNRLLLRPIQAEDAEDMFLYAQDEQVARPGLWEPYPSFEECQRHIAQLVGEYNEGLMWWGLEHLEDGRLIGRVQLSNWSKTNARAELSYALNRNYWGKGLMTEAVMRAAGFGWDTLGLHRLEATVLGSNQSSIRLLNKVGMEREGTLRHHRLHWGEWVDIDVYAVLASGHP